MRIIVMGHARHGKDSVCEILKLNFGHTWETSSHFAMKRAVEPYLAAKGITYPNDWALFNDRVNRRSDWFQAIAGYGQGDLTKLGREIFERHSIYCGMRNRAELLSLKFARLVDGIFWVDASKRLPDENAKSITVSAADADWVIDNNGPLATLYLNVMDAYGKLLEKQKKRAY